nr:MAG TPA: hypothetical protein [Caudoviricetes sp.]
MNVLWCPSGPESFLIIKAPVLPTQEPLPRYLHKLCL